MLAQLVAFGELTDSAWPDMPETEQRRWSGLVGQIASLGGFWEPDAPGEPDVLSPAELRPLSQFVGELLNQREVRMPAIKMQWLAGKWVPRGNQRDLFMHNSIYVLTNPWLRECRLCGKPFIAQKTGLYCSVQHMQVAGTRRYREKLRRKAERNAVRSKRGTRQSTK
jgi:hypothetical protein